MENPIEVKSYIENLEAGEKSRHTVRAYTKDIQKMYAHFSITNVNQLETIDTIDFQNFYSAQNISANSRKGLIRNLTAYINWLIGYGYIVNCNLLKVRFGKSRFPKVIRERKTMLNRAEQQMLIDAGGNKQERFMLAMMLKTALRRSEVAGIKLADIKDCQILITKKGGSQAYTYLNKELCAMMQDYLQTEHTGNSTYLFYGRHGEGSDSGKISGESINSRVRACALRSGIAIEKAEKLHAHSLRAIAVTQTVMQKGKYAGQMLAGHASEQTTNLYIIDNDEYLRELLLGE